jgi:hypothetical protein
MQHRWLEELELLIKKTKKPQMTTWHNEAGVVNPWKRYFT